MTRKKLPNRRFLSIENLEERKVLAGNVVGTVIATPGNLYEPQLKLSGDANANALVISSGVNAGEIIVSGAKDSTGSPTTINGSLTPITFTGITSLSLHLAGGRDAILMTNLNLPNVYGTAHIETGAGDDRVTIASTGPRNFALNDNSPITYGAVNTGGKVTVSTNVGNDSVNLSNAHLREVSYNGGDGNDVFQIDGDYSKNIYGRLQINPGNGDDRVSIKRTQVVYNDLVILDGGDVPANSSHVNIYHTRVGNRTTVSDMKISTVNTANFDLKINNESFLKDSAHELYINSNANANISVRNVKVELLTLLLDQSHSGTISIFDTEVTNQLFADLGAGDDILNLQNVSVATLTHLDGDLGTDTFNDLGGNTLNGLSLTNFE